MYRSDYDFRKGVKMVLSVAARLSSCVLCVGAICCVAACSQTNAFHSTRINDVFCDGNTVSVIATNVEKVSSKGRLPDSGGHLVSETGESWLLTWSLSEDKDDHDTLRAHHLGHYSRMPSSPLIFPLLVQFFN